MVLPVVVIVDWMVWFHCFTVWSDGLDFLLHLSTCSNITDVMTHEYNTQTKEAVVSNEALAKVEENIISTINCLKEEILNLKDIVIKRLQEENKKVWEKCSKLENDVISNESSVNALEQYGRRNSIVVSGIPAHVSERDLEETVISVLSHIEVNVSPNNVEACDRIGKPDSSKS